MAIAVEQAGRHAVAAAWNKLARWTHSPSVAEIRDQCIQLKAAKRTIVYVSINNSRGVRAAQPFICQRRVRVLPGLCPIALGCRIEEFGIWTGNERVRIRNKHPVSGLRRQGLER